MGGEITRIAEERNLVGVCIECIECIEFEGTDDPSCNTHDASWALSPTFKHIHNYLYMLDNHQCPC